MSHCNRCQNQFSLFHYQKKKCLHCGQYFCSKCLLKEKKRDFFFSFKYQCRICQLILHENTNEIQLFSIDIKHLRSYLIHSNFGTFNEIESIQEKNDLINLIQSKKQRNPIEEIHFENNFNEIHLENDQIDFNQNEQINSINSTNENRFEQNQSLKTHLTIDELSSLESIDLLTIRQLKDILTENFISIKGCLEKNDLINKVRLLYEDKYQINSNPNQKTMNFICKICLDKTIDSVLLDCGHLCSCLSCAQQLFQCPICRTFISRVVRVYQT